MATSIVKTKIQVGGMTCTSCETRIEKCLVKLNGVKEVKASFGRSEVNIRFDEEMITQEKIIAELEKLDYTVKNNSSMQNKNEKMPVNQILGIAIILFALYVIIKNTVGFNFIPEVTPNMGYGILFVIGLITSLHCMAMCGGINLSQCMTHADENKNVSGKIKPSILYNGGRVISYTVIGGIVGALGSVISFSGAAKGIVAILSGGFMVIMGLNMLNIFPWLRKLNPRMPRIFGSRLHTGGSQNSPFYVGLLNGLMPCGPLQAMQIYALGTGSFAAGALSMFMFSLGTVPLMFGLGAASAFLSGKFNRKMMKVSAVLVMVLGLIMVSRGLNLSGVSPVLYAASSAPGNVAKIEGGKQVVSTNLQSGSYQPIIVQKGIPVVWTIKADKADLNGCNETIIIPKYNKTIKLEPGDNRIEFTPDSEGNITYTCWMGMISSNIKVVPDLSGVTSSDVDQLNSFNQSGLLGGGCCGAGSQATKFAGGKIPTDDIRVADVKDGVQEVAITVNNQGYSPAVVVLQKGVKARIKFNPEQLNGCNNIIVFPELRGQLNLQSQTETPLLDVGADFTFQCGMNMLHGYVKVVDDINKVDLDDIKKQVENYKPAAGSGRRGCCG